MIQPMQKNYLDFMALKAFIVNKFIKGKLEGRILKKIIFSKEKFDEKEYIEFKKNLGSFEIPESGFSTTRLVLLEEGLEKLNILMNKEYISSGDVYKVLFTESYFMLEEDKVMVV